MPPDTAAIVSFSRYWFLFPVGLGISTLVMSAGVSGATLWVPVYLLWLELDPRVAFWLGLFTMLFGFGSGMLRNWRAGSYDGHLVRRYLICTVPAALLGGWMADSIDQRMLVGGFGLFLFVYAAAIVLRTLGAGATGQARSESVSYVLGIAGGALTGLISVGTGILVMPAVLRHRSIRHPASAVGSLVMIIYFTSVAATVGRLRPNFVAALVSQRLELASILVWAAPAALIGGQLGPRLAHAMPSERHARLYFSAVLLMVGVVTLLRASHIAP